MPPDPPSIAVEILPDPERGAISASGPLRSVQEAEISLSEEDLERLWQPETLERLARGYWRYLHRISLGLLRVVYGPGSRSVVLGSRRLELLRFRAPTYDTGLGFGRVTWTIERGVLVAGRGRGRGYLRFDVRRSDGPAPAGQAAVRVRAVVANYYPLIRGSGRFARLGAFFYAQTQLRLHVLVTRGFLRSLERGDLPEPRA